jgi:Tol biopolymer transport system component
MRWSLVPLALLAVGALACTLTGPPANTPATAVATRPASTAAPGTSAPSQTSSPAPASPSAPASATALATRAATAAATLAPTTAPTMAASPTALPSVAATAAASATPAAGPGCKLAYTDNNGLYCVPDAGAPKALANQPRLFEPLLSPDGALIAYSVVTTDGFKQLWVAAVAEGGAAPHLLVGADQLASGGQNISLDSVNWLAGTHTLVFDTHHPPAPGPGAYYSLDLWRVDADGGAVSAILPAGQAGAFSLSPDGHTIALARGTGLDLIDADGARRRPNVLTFPPIPIFGNSTYTPRPQWSADGSYFTVAIPSPDSSAPNAGISFYRVGADGSVTPRGTLTGSFGLGAGFQTEISPDGARAVIAQAAPRGGAETLHLLTLQTGAPGDKAFDHQQSAGVSAWSPDSQHFAYIGFPASGGGRGYVVDAAGGSPQPFIDSLTDLEWLSWADATHLVYIAQRGGATWALYRQALGSAPQTVVSGLSAAARFDARP